MKKIIITIVILATVGIGYYFYSQQKSSAPVTREASNGTVLEFQGAKKSAHYESNTPAHSAVLPGVPINVAVDFNFDLSENSTITITGPDKKDYGAGKTQIDSNKLAMRREIDSQSPDGIYTVNYRACWPDGSCHEGYFQFAIDRALSSQAIDMRGKSEVSIDMKDISFSPKMTRLSRGTKVTWTNSDEVIHYINTDSHPAHTYYPKQNSKALEKGDMYSLTFDQPGVYPYHCSAHAGVMTGILIVQ